MSLDVNISEPEEFNCIELHSCIKNVAQIKGIEDFEYHVDFICGKGEHFVANIFRVLIKETENENNNISVIVKTLVNTTRQELFHELHKREVNVYNEVVPKFLAIQEELQVNSRVILPKVLLSMTEKGNEILILEDLLLNGFEMNDKFANYENLEHTEVTLVFKELAKFHGLSFVCAKKEPLSYMELKSNFQDILFQDSFLNKSKLRSYFPESFQMSLNVVADTNAKKKLVKVEIKLLHILKKYMQPRKYNVLCHGDCGINNVLFKNEENDETQVCFLDFQAMRYASPITDIIYFLYICTDSTFRSKYFNDVCNIYYESLKSFLELYSMDVNIVYPRKEFDVDLEYYLPFGLIIALLELRIVTTTSVDEGILKGANIVPGLDTSEVPGEIDLFKFKVNDVVKESVDNGVLEKLIEQLNCY